MMIKCLIICFLATSCTSLPSKDSVKSEDIVGIKIFNDTYNRNIPVKIELNDRPTIEQVIREINNIQPIKDTPNLKANLGNYDMQLNYKDGSKIHFFIVYTTYDGVIIQGSDGIVMNKYYKNNKLEMLILSLFLDRIK
jgi:hypothetical protein